MKELFLYVSGEGWKSFQYENLSDLDAEFQTRGITIGDEASIGYKASIGNKASIGYKASIGDEASIGDKASIGDGMVIKNTIFLTASRHAVYYYGLDCIHIGCHRHTIQYWIDNYESVGKSEGYSPDEIAEYGCIIKMISDLHETWAI